MTNEKHTVKFTEDLGGHTWTCSCSEERYKYQSQQAAQVAFSEHRRGALSAGNDEGAPPAR